jgi:L-fuculose-phosphate aldolase
MMWRNVRPEERRPPPGPGMTRTPADMEQSDIRFRIAAARRILYREGCDSNVGGHVSARDEDRADAFWVTGFEYFDQTMPEQVVQMDLDLQPLVGRHELSPAVNFHALIYQRRPDVNAIVHLHSHYLSVLSSTGKTVGMYNVASVLFHEEQATYFDDGIKSHLDVVDALGDKRVVHIKNHGAIVASQSIEHASTSSAKRPGAARSSKRKSSTASPCTASTTSVICGRRI